MIKFRELVFNKWNLFIDSYPTTPSLAFAIYRSNYLEANTIPKITGQMEVDIRKAFTPLSPKGGGVVEQMPLNLTLRMSKSKR